MFLEISDKLTFVISEAGFTYCNCILIADEIRTIIDTGADNKSLLELKPDTVDMVLYSHHHYDHTRGHTFFKNSTSLIHELDYPAIRDEKAFDYYNSMDKWDELMSGVAKEVGQIALNIDPGYQLPSNIEGTFSDQTIFDFGKTKMQVIHTPGHSAGHCSFWFPEEEFLFTGDICLTAAGPWYGEVLADPDDMIKSINKLIELKAKKITSCHVNSIYEDANQRLTNFKNRIYKRDERIYNYLKQQPAGIAELAEKNLIYHYYPSPFVVFWEKLMLIKHLDRLEKMGLIEKAEKGLFVSK